MPDRLLAVDVGANRGWFTIKAAMAGARVAAFEGELLRKPSWAPAPQLMAVMSVTAVMSS